MATASGNMETVQSNFLMYTYYSWEVTYDLDNMKANWKISATVKRTYENPSLSVHYADRVYGDESNNYIRLNNDTVWTAAYGMKDDKYPYAYTSEGSMSADKVAGPYNYLWEGAYVYGYCHLLKSYQYPTDIDEDGNTSLTIRSRLKDYGNTITPCDEKPFTYTIGTSSGSDRVIPKADIFSKVKRVTGSIGNWTDGGYVWEKVSNTHHNDDDWRKRKLYRKDRNTGTASDWVKK